MSPVFCLVHPSLLQTQVDEEGNTQQDEDSCQQEKECHPDIVVIVTWDRAMERW